MLSCLAQVCLATGLAVCVAACGVLLPTSEWWIALFSSSRDVHAAVVRTLPCVALAVLGYSANTILSGVLRGAGRQATGLWINLVTLWVVGLPVAAGLALWAGWGNLGLWAGIALMNLLQGGVMALKVARFNWAKEVQRSKSVVSLHASTFGGAEDVVEWGEGEGEVRDGKEGGDGDGVGEEAWGEEGEGDWGEGEGGEEGGGDEEEQAEQEVRVQGGAGEGGRRVEEGEQQQQEREVRKGNSAVVRWLEEAEVLRPQRGRRAAGRGRGQGRGGEQQQEGEGAAPGVEAPAGDSMV